jgi:transcriptional regulator with XRE-family HTH domain
MNTFGDNLREIREDKGMSQAQLAQELHLCRANISRWESGKVSPQVRWVYEIAKVLKVNPMEFLR